MGNESKILGNATRTGMMEKKLGIPIRYRNGRGEFEDLLRLLPDGLVGSGNGGGIDSEVARSRSGEQPSPPKENCLFNGSSFNWK